MQSVCVQKRIDRKYVKRAIDKLECGKAVWMNGITAEMLKYGGETMIEWMCLICDLTWTQRSIK